VINNRKPFASRTFGRRQGRSEWLLGGSAPGVVTNNPSARMVIERGCASNNDGRSARVGPCRPGWPHKPDARGIAQAFAWAEAKCLAAAPPTRVPSEFPKKAAAPGGAGYEKAMRASLSQARSVALACIIPYVRMVCQYIVCILFRMLLAIGGVPPVMARWHRNVSR
jgi:hypothetical protein